MGENHAWFSRPAAVTQPAPSTLLKVSSKTMFISNRLGSKGLLVLLQAMLASADVIILLEGIAELLLQHALSYSCQSYSFAYCA